VIQKRLTLLRILRDHPSDVASVVDRRMIISTHGDGYVSCLSIDVYPSLHVYNSVSMYDWLSDRCMYSCTSVFVKALVIYVLISRFRINLAMNTPSE
jgi:hypothetical protein